jgi:hypothetical protein
MEPIVCTIDVDLPPAGVFSYATDVLRFGEWQKDVVSVRMAEDGPAGLGARFVTTRRIGPRMQSTTQQITENNPPYRWAARGVEGPLRPHGLLTVEPRGDGIGSRITLALDFEAHGIGVAILPLVRRATRTGAQVSLGNLKRLLEGTAG